MAKERVANNPHNNLFQFGISRPETARRIIAAALGEGADVLDFETLEQVAETLIDAELRDSYSDALFKVHLKPAFANEISFVFVYCLLEHKSRPDKTVSLQLLRYMVSLWERQLRDRETLCPIIPMVIYHGESSWTVARSFEQLVPYPECFADFAVRFRYPMLDLWRKCEPVDDDEIFLFFWMLLQYGASAQFLDRLANLRKLLTKIRDREPIKDYVSTLVGYVVSTNRAIPEEQMQRSLEELVQILDVEPGSVGDQWLRRGKAIGHNEGFQQGIERGIERGVERGIEQGRVEGELRGQIRLLQQLLAQSVFTDADFANQDSGSLHQLLEELKDKAKHRN
jgi:predicted transposase YdaD